MIGINQQNEGHPIINVICESKGAGRLLLVAECIFVHIYSQIFKDNHTLLQFVWSSSYMYDVTC